MHNMQSMLFAYWVTLLTNKEEEKRHKCYAEMSVKLALFIFTIKLAENM